MTSCRLRRGGLALGAVAVVLAAGCAGNGGNNGGTPAPAAPPTTSAAPATTVRPECANLVSSAQALVTTAGQFLSGQATGDQVRAAAQELSSSIDAARTVVGSQTSARLDDAKAALGRLQSALTAQPPNLAAVRTEANAALAATRDAVTLCQSGTSAPTTSG